MTSNKRHETITCRGSLYQTQDLYISKSYDNSNVRRHLQSHMVPHRCISPQHNVQMHSRHSTIFRCILRLILVTPATYGVDDGYAVTEESTTAACRKWPMIILHSLGQLRGVILLTLWILTNYLKLPLPDEKLPTAVSCWSTWPCNRSPPKMKAVLIVAWETPWVMSDSRWFKSKTQTLLTFFESSSSPVESAHHSFTFERKRWKVGGVRTHTALKCLNVNY